MNPLHYIFENNDGWAKKINLSNPDFFVNLAKQQNPEYLLIGCSDSRVPAAQIMGLKPGDVFVHRNIANLVYPTDTNCLSVLQFAIENLKIKHIIICGHYNCGGVNAAMQNNTSGPINTWLQNVRESYHHYKTNIDAIEGDQKKIDVLCEINVIEQMRNVCGTEPVRQAWQKKQHLTVHGWIYNLNTGLLKDMGFSISQRHNIPSRDQIVKSGIIGF